MLMLRHARQLVCVVAAVGGPAFVTEACSPPRVATPPRTGRHRVRVGPEAAASGTGVTLGVGEVARAGGVGLVPPSQTRSDQLQSEIASVQRDASDPAAVTIDFLDLDGDGLVKDEFRHKPLRGAAKRLALLGRVDAPHPYANAAAADENVDGVAVAHAHATPGELLFGRGETA